MKKILLPLFALLAFSIVQAETWWMEQDKPLAIQSNIACDSIKITVYDSGTVMHEDSTLKYTSANLVSGSGYLYTGSAYSFSSGWVGAYHIGYNLFADDTLKGSAWEVFVGAWYDSMRADVSGIDDLKDSIPVIRTDLAAIQTDLDNPNQYKADTSGLSRFDPSTDTVAFVDSLIEPFSISLTAGEIADSVWDEAEAQLLLLFNASDSVLWFSPDSLKFFYGASTGKKTATISAGKVTKEVNE